MDLKEYLNKVLYEDKPIGEKNKVLWLSYLREKYFENNDDLYITFVSEDKVGINPQSKYNTPIGVCTYPLKWTLEYTKKYDLPFMSTNPKKIKILKLVSDKILNKSFTEEQFKKILNDNYSFFKSNIKKYEDLNNEDFLLYLNNIGSSAIVDSPFGKLMKLTRDSVDKNPKKWTELLIKLGFELIEDSGQGIIHESEPVQTIFLTPSSYKVIDETYINTKKRYEDTNKTGGIDSIIQDLESISMIKSDNMIPYLKYHSTKIVSNKFENINELKRFCNVIIRCLIRDNDIERDKIDFVFKLFKSIFVKFVHSFDINSYGFLNNIRNKTKSVIEFLNAYDKIDPGYIENKLYNSLTPNQYSMEMFNYVNEDVILNPKDGYYKNIIKKLIDKEYIIIFDEFPTSLLKGIVEKYHKEILDIYKKDKDDENVYDAFPKSTIKFLKSDLKESFVNLLSLLTEEEFDLNDANKEDLYKTFKQTYEKSTGTSWDFDKFVQRSKNWKFFGNIEGFVTVRIQKSGFWKITGCAGSTKGILKGLDELISKNVPLWTAASGEIVDMLKKKDFIVFKGVLYGFAIKTFVDNVDPVVFGDEIEKVESDGAIVFNLDGKMVKKYFACNKLYLKEAIKSNKVPEIVRKVLGQFL